MEILIPLFGLTEAGTALLEAFIAILAALGFTVGTWEVVKHSGMTFDDVVNGFKVDDTQPIAVMNILSKFGAVNYPMDLNSVTRDDAKNAFQSFIYKLADDFKTGVANVVGNSDGTTAVFTLTGNLMSDIRCLQQLWAGNLVTLEVTVDAQPINYETTEQLIHGVTNEFITKGLINQGSIVDISDELVEAISNPENPLPYFSVFCLQSTENHKWMANVILTSVPVATFTYSIRGFGSFSVGIGASVTMRDANGEVIEHFLQAFDSRFGLTIIGQQGTRVLDAGYVSISDDPDHLVLDSYKHYIASDVFNIFGQRADIGTLNSHNHTFDDIIANNAVKAKSFIGRMSQKLKDAILNGALIGISDKATDIAQQIKDILNNKTTTQDVSMTMTRETADDITDDTTTDDPIDNTTDATNVIPYPVTTDTTAENAVTARDAEKTVAQEQEDIPDITGYPTIIPIPPLPIISGGASKMNTIQKVTDSQMNQIGGIVQGELSAMLQSGVNVLDVFKSFFTTISDSIIAWYGSPFEFSTSGSDHIRLGTIDTGLSAPVVSNRVQRFSCGHIMIPRIHGDFMDYTGTKIQLHLPHLGFVSLNPQDVMGRMIYIYYTVDAETGECIISLRVKGGPVDMIMYEFQCPAFRNNLFSAAGHQSEHRAVASAIGGIAAGALTGNPLIAAAGMAGSIATAGDDIQRAGNMGGNAPTFDDRHIYAIVDTVKPLKPENYEKYNGTPSNFFAPLSTLKKGYIKYETVEVANIPGLTESEKQRLKNILTTGFYK